MESWESRREIIDYTVDQIIDRYGDIPIYVQGNYDIVITFGDYAININTYKNRVGLYHLPSLQYVRMYKYKSVTHLIKTIDFIFNKIGPPPLDY